jgi:hypothetical protein
MAKVWKVREGNTPTIGGPWFETPFCNCIVSFGLTQRCFVQGLPQQGQIQAGPRFGKVNERTDGHIFPTIVVVETCLGEAIPDGWQPGFYKLPITIEKAGQIAAEENFI